MQEKQVAASGNYMKNIAQIQAAYKEAEKALDKAVKAYYDAIIQARKDFNAELKAYDEAYITAGKARNEAQDKASG